MEIEYEGFRRRRPPQPVAFRVLRGLTAGLIAITGIETAAGTRRGAPVPSHGLRVVPTFIAPLAVSAHVVHGMRPTRRSASMARLTDGLTLAAGAAGALASVLAALEDAPPTRLRPRARSLPSLAPLAFALAGAVGLAVGAYERRREEDVEQWEAVARRARIVERLVPRRRGPRDRFIIRP